jgi:RHS repeat-associated protein
LDIEYLPTWYDLRTDPAKALQEWPDTDAQGQPLPDNAKRRAAELDAANKAAAHADTPTTAHFDALGRPFLTLARNRVVCANHLLDGTADESATRVELDIEGNQREVRDERKKPDGTLEQRIVMRYAYDMLGNRIHQLSMEAGARWMLNDVAGEPIRAWDSRGHSFRTEYDPLRRPVRSFVTGADPDKPNQELLTERLVYGEQHPEDELRNLRAKPYLHLDQAGVVAGEARDFKGNPLRISRRIAREYKQAINWSTVNAALPSDATTKLNPAALEAALAPLLETDTFTSRTTYDALNRPLTATSPDGSVYRPTFNDANLLNKVDVNLGATVAATPFITNIDYDAKGQRTLIQYGNGAETRYRYDHDTFRLIHLYTRRGALFTADCENPTPPPPDTIAAPETPPANKYCGLQNLHYTYDPAGNITHIRDDAQQTIYFRNKRVEPSNDYTYDAIYRLIEATGREHLGQMGGQARPPTAADVFNAFHTRLDHPGDGNAMGTYVEQYVYDAVGNFLSMQHRGSDPAHLGWTRGYEYSEASLIEPLKQSNRLSKAPLNSAPPSPTKHFAYDAYGNMTRMPHLPLMQWDYRDQLRATAQQVVNNGGTPETVYYVYDSGGQRVRKVTESQIAAGQISTRMKERIYLGGFEIYREYQNDGNTIALGRETLNIMDDKQRIAIAETRTFGNDPAPARSIRYQFGNHLGAASLELDDQAQIISHEEYTPYGSTSYQAVPSQTETPKRYRYTGKERDEESGLYYHGARYYAPWLGRWVSVDPIGIADGVNVYGYVGNNPIRFLDLFGKKKGDKLPEHKGNIGRFSERELNDAIKTVYGELTAKPHKETRREAKAIASTIFNRLSDITLTRANFSAAEKSYKTAQSDLVTEEADVSRANAKFEKLTKKETQTKRGIAKQITEKDPTKRKAIIQQKFDQAVKAAKDTIAKEKGDVKAALGLVKKEFGKFEIARDAKIDAESVIKESKRNDESITLSDIVELDAQYDGTDKGIADFTQFPAQGNAVQAQHKERYEEAVKAVVDLAKNPAGADKFRSFKGGDLRPDGALSGETKIGGNYFSEAVR